MRCGLLIYGTLATVSGGYLYDRQLADALIVAGHMVEIISVPWRSYPRHLTDNWSTALVQSLQVAQFDILLQDELNHPSLALLNRRLHTRVQYPIVSIVHHLRCSEEHPKYLLPFYRWVEQRYLQSVESFIYNSQTTRNSVMHLADNHKPSIIAYPAADHRQPPTAATIMQRLEKKTVGMAPLQILFVGNVIARKGLHHLLAALAEIPRWQWHLLVVGSLTTAPDYVQQIEQTLHTLDLTANVSLFGACSDDMVRHFYQTTDLFAAPAYEGFGIAYLEAMSFGLPVIASTAGAAHEIVTDGVDGYLVDPTDIATLTTHIARFCQDRTQLAAMGRAARQRYDRHPTWQETFTPVVAWLEEQVK